MYTYSMNFLDAKKIHFIAIGGIGVSALAKLCHNNGILITGSDITESDITKDLKNNLNISITIGSNPDMLTKDIDYVIYSPAVPKSDNEYLKAQKLGIPLLSYPEALGEISKHKTTIAISGTNGKTTTTTMIVEAMKNQNINPTGIIGGILQKYHSNFLDGDSEYFITEACEYKRSFLNIHHDIAVITNITLDHLDYFDDLNDIQSAFSEFINNNKGNGKIICNKNFKNLEPIISNAKKNNIDIVDYSKYLDDIYQISIPGKHNRENMAATLATIDLLKLNVTEASKYLATQFMGTKRRMEYIGKTKHGAILYDDYAHNPEGIELLINGLKKYHSNKKIIILFEPHLYSRTKDFKEEFGRTLSLADILYLFPVYKAREKSQPEKDFLLEKYISKTENFYIIKNPENFKEIFESKKYDEHYIIVTVGAGAIWQHGLSIKN